MALSFFQRRPNLRGRVRYLEPVAVLAVIALATYFIWFYEAPYELPVLESSLILAPRTDIRVTSPYENVDWGAYERHRANLHTHTRRSDGLYRPRQVIDEYHERGYTILAIADHNRLTWPWQKHGRDPEELGMLAVRGNEISDVHHIGSYLNDFDIDGRRYRPLLWPRGSRADIDEEGVFQEIGERQGLAVFFHPGRYVFDPEFYAGFFERHEHLVGLEVVNQRDRYRGDRELWDEVLTLLMPERPVWGFANDDMHFMRHVGHSYNVFLLPELTKASFRKAMIEGSFYFSHGDEPPTIESIEVDNDSGHIRVVASGQDDIAWISEGRAIHHGDTLEFRSTRNVGSYVRAKLMGPGGNTYTNPFGVTGAPFELVETDG